MDIGNFTDGAGKPGIMGSQTAASGDREKSDAKLRKACADFEGVLLQYMFESMKKTVGEGGVFGGGAQQRMYESMFIQEVSATLARKSGIGIGDALYRQLKGREDETTSLSGDRDNRDAKGANRINRYK